MMGHWFLSSAHSENDAGTNTMPGPVLSRCSPEVFAYCMFCNEPAEHTSFNENDCTNEASENS